MSKQKKYKYMRGNFMIGLTMISILILVAIFADFIAPYEYDDAFLDRALEGPSSEFLFGTDAHGRDVFSRIIYGSRIALQIALISVGIQIMIGVTLGLSAGYFGGIIDRIVCFIADATWALPPLIIGFAVVSILGEGLINAIVAIALVSWAQYARIVRIKTMSIKNMPFIETGIVYGENTFVLIIKYILPNIIPPLVVVASMSIPGAIMSTTALSFLGLGAQPPSPDWGLALSQSMARITTAPWLTIYPGLALVFTTFGFTMLGEGLRDMIDPRMKSM